MGILPQIDIQLVTTPPEVGVIVRNGQAAVDGAVATFVGTVRGQTKGRKVIRLEFEAYEPMARLELRKIAASAADRFQLNRVSIHHYLGVAPVGMVVVVIAVTAPHRRHVFEACQYCIDTLKETVPIWKKEIFEDGEVWVSATP